MRQVRIVLAVVAVALAASLGAAEREDEASEKAAPPRPKPVAPAEPGEIDAAIDRGAAFLLERQNKDGSWGTARRTKGLDIYAPVPGAHQAFRAAVTSLCVSALLEARPGDSHAVAAVDRAETWLVENLPQVRRATPDAIYNSWAHCYAIQALSKLHRRTSDGGKKARLAKLLAGQIERLDRYECVDGGWCYYDFNAHTKQPSGSTISFVTGAVLVALDEARATGAAIPSRTVDRAVESIRRQRKPDFSYAYGEYLKLRPMHPVNRPGGSLGRSQCCNLALRLWGDASVTDETLETWLDRLFARNLWLDIGRKRPIPHESWFAVAGYFFYFGHYYAARCIEQLPPAARPRHQDQLAHVLLALQEKDGSWWDFPLYDYHQPYGTAFAMMALVRCRR